MRLVKKKKGAFGKKNMRLVDAFSKKNMRLVRCVQQMRLVDAFSKMRLSLKGHPF